MRRIAWPLVLIPLAVGCDDASSEGEADAGPPVSLWVDTDRDGVLSAADVAGQDTWTAEQGAVFLANADDDDEDGDPDADDDEVNGEADALDLARLEVTAWADAPDGAHGALEIDGLDRVRWFRKDGAAWTDVGAATVRLDTAALRTGATFGIEGLALLENDEWDGRVTVRLTYRDGPVEVDDEDPMWSLWAAAAVLRQAPIVLSYNTMPTLRVFVSDTTYPEGFPLLTAVDDLALETDVENHTIDALDEDYVNDGFFPDQWTQDFFEIGATYLPAAGGVHRMGVGIRLKPGSQAGYFVEKELFGPDFASVYPFLPTYESYSSIDYGGNLEVVPPHEGYPVGRTLVGSTPDRPIDDHYGGLLDAQYAQAPMLRADTSWLAVGHIDEVLSFVADPSSPRGWKALLQSPAEAWQMLLDLVAADPDNANLLMFQGKEWGLGAPADMTVGEVLADAEFAAAQDSGQAYADELRDLLEREVGLTDDDIVEMPFLWESFPPYGFLALSPGVVNLLTLNGHALVPRPYGPVVDGEDLFSRVPRERLEALGLTVTFVDIWDLYHANWGEVHCGTNVDRTLAEDVAWWEVSR
jgi:protein-arginine deiminase